MPSVQEAQALAAQAIQYDNARDIHNAIASYRKAVQMMLELGDQDSMNAAHAYGARLAQLEGHLQQVSGQESPSAPPPP
eukprot:CAMPEP_0182897042 /NCGR_PEP_ID=MMETSP0034_2-20130328/26652_1 /TAXON_ID=156128 /ORGANISM="Nephroselmis pyriformis, Strain CCMP717" /LENGTH=78 /DNA_ID=CAMNT_0025030937 /DNA_START=28 /DNA_END=261 /DNA_ORIENTATION=+